MKIEIGKIYWTLCPPCNHGREFPIEPWQVRADHQIMPERENEHGACFQMIGVTNPDEEARLFSFELYEDKEQANRVKRLVANRGKSEDLLQNATYWNTLAQLAQNFLNQYGDESLVVLMEKVIAGEIASENIRRVANSSS